MVHVSELSCTRVFELKSDQSFVKLAMYDCFVYLYLRFYNFQLTLYPRDLQGSSLVYHNVKAQLSVAQDYHQELNPGVPVIF